LVSKRLGLGLRPGPGLRLRLGLRIVLIKNGAVSVYKNAYKKREKVGVALFSNATPT